MPAYSRVFVPPSSHPANANTYCHYPAEKAAWIWHPDVAATETCVLRFRLKFSVTEAARPLIHVTADQRFQLRLDGDDVTFGPDRCDLAQWTVQTIQLDLAPGEHELEAIAWYITELDGTVRPDGTAGNLEESTVARPPMAQVTWRGGFLLYGEGVDESLLTTGKAAWQVENVTAAVKMVRPDLGQYLDVGPIFTIDLEQWSARSAKPAQIIMEPLRPNPHGVRRPGWALYPADLQEQERLPWKGGKMRAYRAHGGSAPYSEAEAQAPELAGWQELLAHGQALTVPAHTECTVLWDFETYACGYPVTATEGGHGALIQWNWAESLFETADGGTRHKGNRAEILHKVFHGLEDGWVIGTGAKSTTPSLWWRCGRYVQIRVQTAATPLIITGLSIITTGYPLDTKGAWKSSDTSWDALIPLFDRAYKIAAHETWTDTPYYEQMCYVGDNLLNAVSNYAWFGDALLSRRSIQLYEWSRRATGLVAERYPSGWRQECLPFTMYWPVMVRDYAWWRDDQAFIKAMLPGLRSVIAELDALIGADGRLHAIPGWPFVDWVTGWDNGCAPGAREGDSSVMNLLYIMALQATAQIEEAYGEPLYAQRHRRVARTTMDLVLARYWDAQQGLLLDTPGFKKTSEHPQMFALLTGLLDESKTQACLAALKRGLDFKATIWASYYTLESCYRHGDAAEFYRRLEYWRTLPGLGFTATPEAPEPTRSDSHPWGAHPLYHTLASIAGVRPAAPGFAKVRIAPLLNGQENFTAKVVHPRGFVEVAYDKAGNTFAITLPEGITGTLEFAGKTHALKAGKNDVTG